MPFDQIEDAVQRGEVDVGLLIHEGQLTYGDAGLHLWADLGAWWMEETGLPLPLGGNAVRRDLGSRGDRRRSPAISGPASCTAWSTGRPAWPTPSSSIAGIGDERTDTFVGMYVNQWTVDYGPRGREAVQLLLDRAYEAGMIPERVQVEFVG